MKSDNNWYGHREILSKYAGLKFDKPCFATIQHGYLNKFFLKSIKIPIFKFIPYLCWNSQVKNNLFKKGFYNVYEIGAPFIYLTKLIKFKKKIRSKNEILFFPPHNTVDYQIHSLNYDFIFEKIKKTLKKKITVCLYYSDFQNKKLVKFLKKRKFKVISLVSRSKKNSLFNLYKAILSYRYVVVCDVSSVLFYSMLLKRETRVLLKNDNETFLTKKIINDEKFIFHYKKKYPQLFKKYLNKDIGYKIAYNELGMRFLRPKNQIKKLLGWDNKIKIFFSKIFYFYYNLKYSSRFRHGLKNN